MKLVIFMVSLCITMLVAGVAPKYFGIATLVFILSICFSKHISDYA
jgi:hypothetical protein